MTEKISVTNAETSTYSPETTTIIPTTNSPNTTEKISVTYATHTDAETSTKSVEKFTPTSTALPLDTTTTNFHRSGNLRTHPKNIERKEKNVIVPVIMFGILLIGATSTIVYIVQKKKKQKRPSVIPMVDEPLDPVIATILDEQDLKNQLRINKWRMAKLHKYLKKKNTNKEGLVEHMEKNSTLMEKIHIQIKNSPVQIYKKRGKKIDAIPTLTVDFVPTMKVDLMTALKEPEKVKHISSIAKLKMKLLPALYEHRRKRKNFKPLKQMLLPVNNQLKRPRRKAPQPPKSELEVLKDKKLVSNSIFKK